MDLSVKGRLTLGFGVIVVLLLLVSILAYTNLNQVFSSVRILEGRSRKIELVSRLQSSLKELVWAGRTFLVDPKGSNRERFLTQSREVSARIEALAQTPTADEERRAIQEVGSAFFWIKRAVLRDSLGHKVGHPMERVAISRQVDDVYRGVETNLQTLTRLAKRDQSVATMQAEQARRMAISLTSLGGLTAILVAIFLGYRTTRSILGPLRGIIQHSEQVRRGDLGGSVQVRGTNEIAQVGQSFDRMVARLRDLIAQIHHAGYQLGGASEEIFSCNEGLARNSLQQADAVKKATATMEGLLLAAKRIADDTTAVEVIAQETGARVQRGSEAMLETVEAINAIEVRMDGIAQKTLSLGKKSEQIGQVLEIIKDIADEVHILALNAAIESSAAGEHGRRFAVVASEVRRLAERTRESTEDIKHIVSEIQRATDSSVGAAEDGLREVRRGVEIARHAQSLLSGILEGMERTTHSTQQIALATQEQRSASEHVVRTMREISELLRETAAGSQQSQTEAGSLRGLATRLLERIGEFRGFDVSETGESVLVAQAPLPAAQWDVQPEELASSIARR
jgi:methyl-accepting chemotaxis protein